MKLLFVCLGNICRSPTADAITRQLIASRNLGNLLECDSAGTGDWHIGLPADQRAVAAAAKRGYDLTPLRARQLCVDDFYQFDHILVMDNNNLKNALSLQPTDSKAEVSLLLDYLPEQPVREVPDPYYGAGDGFETVLDLLEQAIDQLLNELVNI